MNFFKTSNIRNHSDNLYLKKYAPKKLSDFRGNPGVRQTLESFFESKPINLPNLIFSGPHGCGKSLLAKLAVRQYLGIKYMNEGCLEIYGSLSRGKDVVSEKQSVKNKQKNFNCPGIMNFMKKRTQLPEGMLKIALIYEFHQMSQEAQMALRRIMEIYSHRIRFMFVTERSNGIIPAIQSRCTPLKLQKLSNEELDEIMDPIITGEQLIRNDEMLELIRLNADGDIRIAVNLLQVIGKTQESADWYNILGIPEIKTIKKIIAACLAGNSLIAYSESNKLLSQGFEICDLLDLFTRVLIYHQTFDKKDEYLMILGRDTLAIEECYTETQFYNLINHLTNS
jgi:DNA polymerase III delta prime subunit